MLFPDICHESANTYLLDLVLVVAVMLFLSKGKKVFSPSISVIFILFLIRIIPKEDVHLFGFYM